VVERLRNAAVLYHKAGQDLGPVKHYILSPPQDWAIELIQTKDGSIELRVRANEILRSNGFLGGCIIFHPFRKFILFNGKWIDEETANNYLRKKIKNLKDPPVKWIWGPHFHIIGWGYLTQSDDFFDQTGGWVYKNLGPRRSVYDTAFYLLTHAGLAYSLSSKSLVDRPILTKRLAFHTVRWLGIASYPKLCVDHTEIVLKYIECPICGDHVFEYESNFVVDLNEFDPYIPVVPPLIGSQ